MILQDVFHAEFKLVRCPDTIGEVFDGEGRGTQKNERVRWRGNDVESQFLCVKLSSCKGYEVV